MLIVLAAPLLRYLLVALLLRGFGGVNGESCCETDFVVKAAIPVPSECATVSDPRSLKSSIWATLTV